MESFLFSNHALSKKNVLDLALTIRNTENKLLTLFREGRLNGTVHTSVGQEFSAICATYHLKQGDFVFSNHRCHGHFLAHGGSIESLIGELAGKEIGACKGVGGSQHLYKEDFYSNGIQGSIMPVSAGLALSNKYKNKKNIGIVFIGDGTMGQGAVYETFNMLSLYKIPLIVVCENNKIAQTTSIETNTSSKILERAKSFNIKVEEGKTSEPIELLSKFEKAVKDCRENNEPYFFEIHTNRLNAHSKGDDTRDQNLIDQLNEQDLLNNFINTNNFSASDRNEEIKQEIDKISDSVISMQNSTFKYSSYVTPLNDDESQIIGFEGNVVERINSFFKDELKKENTLFIGEDIESPYGGAFKAAKDLTSMFPDKTISTPISEQAISGLGNGLALGGVKTYVEYMFGDFACLGFDQIVNSAAKFHHMYAENINCPVVYRMPMGGKRGYGPTHSQSLEKHFGGVENISLIALNRLIDPKQIYKRVSELNHPVLVIENKSDYSLRSLESKIDMYDLEVTNHYFPLIFLQPSDLEVDTTIITYGGNLELALELSDEIFSELELSAQIICITQINNIDIDCIINKISSSSLVITIEESSISYGFGSEVISQIVSKDSSNKKFLQIGSEPFPIPSASDLENAHLPNMKKILKEVESKID